MDSALELIKEMQHRLLCTSEIAVIDAVAESGSVQDITTLGCHMEVSVHYMHVQAYASLAVPTLPLKRYAGNVAIAFDAYTQRSSSAHVRALI